MIAGLQLMRNSLYHLDQKCWRGAVLEWFYSMRESRRKMHNKQSAISGIEFAHKMGFRALKNVFKLILRGEVGLRMFIWRRNISNEKDARYREIRVKYEAQSRHFSQLF